MKCSLYAESKGPIRANDLVSLKLTPELEQSLVNGELSFKASDTESYICTPSKTFRLSGSSCNPTICLLENDIKDAEGFCLTTAVKTNLVADECKGSIDWGSVPKYSEAGLNGHETLKDLKLRSFCSDLEFDALWLAHGGLEVDGHACIVTDDLVHKLAIELNSGIFEHGEEDFDLVYESCTKEYPQELYRAVFRRFWPETDSLASWIGKRLLRQMKAASSDAFITRWKRDLLGHNLSLELISGHFVDIHGELHYVNRDTLPTNPKDRIAALFKIKNEWEFSALLPFVSDLTNINEKRAAESYIKNYAKVVNTGDPKVRGRIIKKVMASRH